MYSVNSALLVCQFSVCALESASHADDPGSNPGDRTKR
jgi:hypothetical protein